MILFHKNVFFPAEEVFLQNQKNFKTEKLSKLAENSIFSRTLPSFEKISLAKIKGGKYAGRFVNYFANFLAKVQITIT